MIEKSDERILSFGSPPSTTRSCNCTALLYIGS